MVTEGQKYAVVESESAEDLIDEIEDLMSAGWECLGGLAVWTEPVENGDAEVWYAQAMIKK